MKKVIGWLDNKKIAVLSIIFFTISTIPVLYLAKYARPSGDDYGYSVLTRAAWVETHSLIEVIKAACKTVQQMYIGWNGDWFTTFLFSLMPEVFVTYSFVIVPYIMVGALILGTSVFLYDVLVKIVGIGWEYAAIFASLLLFASIQFIPSTAIGMYWYVGATHYIIPHMLALFALAFGFRFYRTDRKREIAYATLCMFAVGGSSFFSSLLVFMIYGVLMILFFRKKKNILLLILPYAVGVIGFIIQCIAPGNKVRAGESFGFHISDAFLTVWNSLYSGWTTIWSYLEEKTFIFILLFLCAVFGWQALLERKSSFRFRYPLLFVIFMYGIYSAMWAPAIYSAVDVSLGPATIVYFTFLLTSLFSILYVEGWLIELLREKGKNARIGRIFLEESEYRNKVAVPLIVIGILITVVNLNWFGNSTDKRVYDYVSSGQAEDFKRQIESHMEILLDDSIKEAYLIPINDKQGPLMHMPVTEDPEEFTNRVVRDFYRKDKVVMVVP